MRPAEAARAMPARQFSRYPLLSMDIVAQEFVTMTNVVEPIAIALGRVLASQVRAGRRPER